MFQFLMVRLEEGKDGQLNEATEVSIPYGSIRRVKLVLDPPLNDLFQFLMVRLEAGLDIIHTLSEHLFQFLMVRLEGAREAELVGLFHDVSIPYGSIRSNYKTKRG